MQRFLSCGTDATEARAAHWITTGDAVSGILETVVAERRTLRGDNPGGDPTRLGLPVLHPEVRTFLAAPIASAAHVYGWICLVGNEGRTFTDDDEHLVKALSGQVGRIYELEHEILERKLAESALRTAEERMRFALEAAGVGIWDMDFTTGVLRWSEILESQYGLPPGTFGGTFEAFVACVHPADRQSLLDQFGKDMKSGADFSQQNRALWPDGTVRYLSSAGRFVVEHGKPVRAVGITQDITERRTLEEQYQQAQKMDAIGRLAGGVAGASTSSVKSTRARRSRCISQGWMPRRWSSTRRRRCLGRGSGRNRCSWLRMRKGFASWPGDYCSGRATRCWSPRTRTTRFGSSSGTDPSTCS